MEYIPTYIFLYLSAFGQKHLWILHCGCIQLNFDVSLMWLMRKVCSIWISVETTKYLITSSIKSVIWWIRGNCKLEKNYIHTKLNARYFQWNVKAFTDNSSMKIMWLHPKIATIKFIVVGHNRVGFKERSFGHNEICHWHNHIISDLFLVFINKYVLFVANYHQCQRF